MGSIAKGKVNASEATEGMRIIVKVSYDADGHATIRPSSTKTGEGVFVARIIEKGFRAAGRYEARGKYVIHTSAGSFDAAPIQTMWLAPEDPAGIKRARAEAELENADREAETERAAASAAQAAQDDEAAVAYTRQIEAAEAELAAAVPASQEAGAAPAAGFDPEAGASAPDANRHASQTGGVQALTLDSQACKVGSNSENDTPEDSDMAQNLTHDEARNYLLSTGETADLIALVSARKPADWVQATEAQPIGTVVYAYAMGELRRGVVVKNTPTKTLVALTTAAAAAPGGSVRVQTATELHTTVYVAPAPEVPAEPAQEAEEGAERFTLTETQIEENAAQSEAENLADAEAARTENEAPGGIYARPTSSRALQLQMAGRALRLPEPARVLDLLPPLAHGRELVRLADIAPSNLLTLNSQAGKVGLNSEDDNTEEPEMTATTEIETPATEAKNHTGSTVVALIERVWDAIRAEHPELPPVIVTTGSGEGMKWGHFRPESWKLADSGEKYHEFFLASEALAKGAFQVLQTTIHEAAHTLNRVRGNKDTSRQNRYHNGTFRKTAEELGLEHRGASPDKTLGFSFVTLTAATKTKYAAILADLDRELKLTGLLPFWLGGTDGEDERGGEKITKPKNTGGEGEDGEGETKPQSGNLKATCECPEPIIIRLSRKVLDLGVVRCDSCESLFTAA